MFVSEKIVFIELHKTGSTHIRQLLLRLVEGEIVGKHNRATPELFQNGRSFLGSIRNPWEWYLSLWAYGCSQKGAVYHCVTGSVKGRGWRENPIRAAYSLLAHYPKNPAKWKRCYADAHDTAGFRDWLYMIHDRRYWHDFGEGYGSSAVSELAGLLTYRYLNLFCLSRDGANFREISAYDALQKFERQHCYIDYFIRTKHLLKDLIRALELSGVPLSGQEREKILSSGKRNTSSRAEKPAYYYDPDTIKLICDRERLLVDKFGYEPPTL